MMSHCRTLDCETFRDKTKLLIMKPVNVLWHLVVETKKKLKNNTINFCRRWRFRSNVPRGRYRALKTASVYNSKCNLVDFARGGDLLHLPLCSPRRASAPPTISSPANTFISPPGDSAAPLHASCGAIEKRLRLPFRRRYGTWKHVFIALRMQFNLLLGY